jgi:dienelactone hydrolase
MAEVLVFHHGHGLTGAGEGDVDAAREFVRAAADAELFLYHGASHLFTDSSLPSYDEQSATPVHHRVLGLLDRVK